MLRGKYVFESTAFNGLTNSAPRVRTMVVVAGRKGTRQVDSIHDAEVWTRKKSVRGIAPS